MVLSKDGLLRFVGDQLFFSYTITMFLPCAIVVINQSSTGLVIFVDTHRAFDLFGNAVINWKLCIWSGSAYLRLCFTKTLQDPTLSVVVDLGDIPNHGSFDSC